MIGSSPPRTMVYVDSNCLDLMKHYNKCVKNNSSVANKQKEAVNNLLRFDDNKYDITVLPAIIESTYHNVIGKSNISDNDIYELIKNEFNRPIKTLGTFFKRAKTEELAFSMLEQDAIDYVKRTIHNNRNGIKFIDNVRELLRESNSRKKEVNAINESIIDYSNKYEISSFFASLVIFMINMEGKNYARKILKYQTTKDESANAFFDIFFITNNLYAHTMYNHNFQKKFPGHQLEFEFLTNDSSLHPFAKKITESVAELRFDESSQKVITIINMDSDILSNPENIRRIVSELNGKPA